MCVLLLGDVIHILDGVELGTVVAGLRQRIAA